MDKNSDARHPIELANEAMPTSCSVSLSMHMADFLRGVIRAKTPDGRIDEMRRFALRNPTHPKAPLLKRDLKSMSGHFFLLFGMKWSEMAYPYVVVDEHTAAALCATASDVELAVLLAESPWDAFVVAVPPGLFPWRNGSCVTAIQVLTDRTKAGKRYWSFVVSGAEDNFSFLSVNVSAEDFATDTMICGLDMHHEDKLSDEETRVLAAARRLVRGIVLWLLDSERRTVARSDDPRSVLQPPPLPPAPPPTEGAGLPEASPRPPAQPSAPSAPSPHASPKSKPKDRKLLVSGYAITAPIKVDCREHVRAYLRGDRASPNVRSLVRGHHKMQVCGAKRQDRKSIWIHPYWRGEDNLPIAVRNHVVAVPSTP